MMWADFSDWLLTVGVIVGYATVVVALIETFAIRSPLRGGATWRSLDGGETEEPIVRRGTFGQSDWSQQSGGQWLVLSPFNRWIGRRPPMTLPARR